MCRTLEVSPSGFYAWCRRLVSAHAQRDQQLCVLIRASHEASRCRYGSPRVHEDLIEQGIPVSRKRVVRLMQAEGLTARVRKRFKGTTMSDHDQPVAANLLDRQFTDDGLPTVRSGVTVRMEYRVEHLGEPRSTSVDVWLDDGEQRVAVECKFTEREFGRCSRPTLRPGRNANYDRDHCDGSYTRQRGRRTHCSLTEIGVRYWQYLPELFDWSADRNMTPCPLDGTYQLARNVLAACVRPDGMVDVDGGHALVIYDDRNPAYLPGGEAARQWDAATGALVRRPLLRRCSWQRLVAHLANDHDLVWLVNGLAAKYGIEPSGP